MTSSSGRTLRGHILRYLQIISLSFNPRYEFTSIVTTFIWFEEWNKISNHFQIVVNFLPIVFRIVPPMRTRVTRPENEVRIGLDLLQVTDGGQDQLFRGVASKQKWFVLKSFLESFYEYTKYIFLRSPNERNLNYKTT